MPTSSRNRPRAGIVDLHVAFSRHDGKKTYVQDLLKAAGRPRARPDRAGRDRLCLRRRRAHGARRRSARWRRCTTTALCSRRRNSRPTTATCWTCGRAAEPRPTRDANAPAICAASSWRRPLLLVFTAVLFVVARHFEPRHWAWGYVAAFAAAATVGGLADWYAVVALFRRPLGLPIPHTAIIPRNHLRIADTLGELHRDQFPGARAGRGAAARGRFRRPRRRLAVRPRAQRGAGGLRAAAAAADAAAPSSSRACEASSASAS